MKLMNIRLQSLDNQTRVVLETITPGYSAMIDPRIRLQFRLLPPDFYAFLQEQNSGFTAENIRLIFTAKHSRCSLQGKENLLLETLELTLPSNSTIIVKDFLEALQKHIAQNEFVAVRLEGTPLHLYSDSTASTIQAEYQPADAKKILQQLESLVLATEPTLAQSRHLLLANDKNRLGTDQAKPASRPGL